MTRKIQNQKNPVNSFIILSIAICLSVTSCVSVKKFNFDNQKTYDYIIEIHTDSSSISTIRNWFSYSFPIDKTENEILSESEERLLINCNTRLNYPAPLPYKINYPTIFKVDITTVKDTINLQFREYMILNYPKSHVINKQIKQHIIDEHFDNLFEQLRIYLTRKQELKSAHNQQQ